MNLQRRCIKCRRYFPVEPEELKFFCDREECQEYLLTFHFYTIKSNRCITLEYFDIYDLNRPILTDGAKIIRYERVCRSCGEPLLNKDGKYSYHRRYCNIHTGYDLFKRYNWGEVSKDYARKVRDENKELIKTKFMEHVNINHAFYKANPKRVKYDLSTLITCEECGKICGMSSSSSLYAYSTLERFDVINIHHIIPVHTLTMKNIHLIWDISNLIALCHECHANQDHQLKKNSKYQYQNILNFI